MEINTEKWINIDEAADYLGVKPGTIRDWIRKKKAYQLTKLVNSGNSSALNWIIG